MPSKVYWCPTKEQSKSFLDTAQRKGYLDESSTLIGGLLDWSLFKEETCYMVFGNFVSNCQKSMMDDYEVVEWECQ